MVFQGQVFFPQILLGVSLLFCRSPHPTKKADKSWTIPKNKNYLLSIAWNKFWIFFIAPGFSPVGGYGGYNPPPPTESLLFIPPPNYMHTRTHTRPHDTQNKFCWNLLKSVEIRQEFVKIHQNLFDGSWRDRLWGGVPLYPYWWCWCNQQNFKQQNLALLVI